jgi:hypothetical protein
MDARELVVEHCGSLNGIEHLGLLRVSQVRSPFSSDPMCSSDGKLVMNSLVSGSATANPGSTCATMVCGTDPAGPMVAHGAPQHQLVDVADQI